MSLEYRPWGYYEVLLDSPECKVKRITVEPNQRLSYQYHERRREVWTVFKGTATIILDDERISRDSGQSIRIPLGAKHRLWNEGTDILQIIEVQTGTYFGEDDIVRLEDDYKRL